MTGVPDGSAEAAAIHAEFAVPVRYTGAGLTDAPVDAVPIDVAADPFMGAGSSARTHIYEIREGVFIDNPVNGDTIVDGADTWRVIDVTRRRDIDAWHLTVELT